ncbi:hypothetical protein Tco_1256814 [Tanacetum coccineum]
MAEENVPAHAPTRSDEQILPFKAWLPIGKGNLLLDLQKLQKNPIFCISVDILQNTNFFRAFTASTNWFTLNADLLRKALEITHVNLAHPFVSPPAGEQFMDFVNELSYPEEIHFVSKMHVNNLYQSWRAILTNVDYVELLWEEFVQAIQIFFAHRANLNVPTKKPTPHVIPYCRFTKLIIFYLGSEHNIHRRPGSPVHVAGDDYLLGNLKFVPKGEKDEGKSSLQLVDEDEEVQHVPEPQIEDDEYNLQRGIQMSLESFQAPVDGVAFREPTKGVTRSLPVVEGKGKAIATDEQVAQSILELQQPKGKSTTDQYIFQRRTPVTKEASTGPLAQPEDDTSANIVCDTPSPLDVETGDKAEMSDSEGDTEILNVGEEKGEDVSNTVALEERIVELMKARLDQTLPMHEDFITTVYPKVLKSLKHTTEEHVFLENPPSSSGTHSSMKNLDDAFTYGDQFLYDKPMEEEPYKANVETEVESMVTVLIHQASSTAHPLSTPVIDLTQPKPVSPPIQELIFTAITATTTTTLPPPPPLQQQSTTDSTLGARISTLEQICANFKKKNKLSEFEMKEILRDRMFESGSYRSQPEHTALYEALEASMDHENREEFMYATAKSRKRHRDDQDPPLPPPKDSDQTWKSSNTREAPSSSSQHKTAPQSEQPVNDVPILDDMHISDSEDTGTAHLSKIKTRPDWLKPVPEEERPETPEPDWVDWEVKAQQSLDLEGPAFKIDLVNPEGNRVVPDVRKPLPLGGPPERRNALSISKLKAAFYQDFRLEELVPSLWIESEREYDISATYVRYHMKILSVISLKTFSQYDYTFLREIVLHRADYKEYKISEADFKILHPTDFKDMYLLHLQGKLNHLSGSDKVHLFNAVNLWIRNIVIRKRVEDLQLSIESYQTKLNLTELSWDAIDFLFKEDYTIVSKPRAIIYKDMNNQKMMMRESEVHKFSDGTLTRILEKLDHMVKDFVLFKFNRGMEHRIWSKDDKRRSKEFIEVIERRLKIRRIFRSLESFVSGRLRDVDYRLI